MLPSMPAYEAPRRDPTSEEACIHVCDSLAPSKAVKSVPQKRYHIGGSLFQVPLYYDIKKRIGSGAYGVVCSAVDLRLVSSSPNYNASLRIVEEGGHVVTYTNRDAGPVKYYKLPSFLQSSRINGGLRVPTLQSEPYQRRVLHNGLPSPYVAIKKVADVCADLVDGRRILREVKVLHHLCGHPNIIRLFDVFRAPVSACDDANYDDLYMVTELMDSDLDAVLRSSQVLTLEHFRVIAYQMIKALVYVHTSDIIHRDVKPGNILLGVNCEVKLCDFGLARGGVPLCSSNSCSGCNRWKDFPFSAEDAVFFQQHQCILNDSAVVPFSSTSSNQDEDPDELYYSLTDYVVTRYYRAPELLIMSRYSHSIDMWSVGCILAEMLLRRPLFAGSNYLSQLALILETPGLRGVPRCRKDVVSLFDGGEEGKNFISDLLFTETAGSEPPPGTVQNSVQLQARFHQNIFGRAGVDVPLDISVLIAKLLSFDPRMRPTALEALRDAAFASLYHASDEVIRCTKTSVAELATQIEDINGYRKANKCVVVEEPPPFLWEFDFRITSKSSLRTLIASEVAAYVELQDQVQRLGDSPS